MDSAEISEWMAYFKMVSQGPEKPKASDVIRAQFAHKVRKK